MQKITIIAAMDNNRGIGLNNKIPWSLPEDMAHFRAETMGKPTIMGRKTFESIASKPLPGRPLAVVSSTLQNDDRYFVAKSLNEAISHFKDAPEIMILGGGGIYAAALKKCTHLVLTLIDTDVQADAFFPEIPWENFTLTQTSQAISKHHPHLAYHINYYKRIDI